MTRVVLSVGSNVGDRLAHLQSAADALRDGLMAVSPVYETEPFGTEPQPAYLNAVLIAEADLDAHAWLAQARAIEAAAGRERPRRWAPRTLDVDLIVVGRTRSADPELTLPHPRAHERAFVLVPWLDVEPDAVLPGVGPVRDLLAGLDPSGVQRRDDLALT
ncbi:MAG: 2-amino-4-hydroxy-6-hydroxymethyldihydropteridine diphosphokinase [Actinomycetota bacterium]|nr:2-amino-4-hydroxy-6-hydroxymethyldihydropteridine diphosphokinase [Actinomycetota bacterium]